MTAAEVVLVILWCGVSAYAILGGADFGAGFWDLFAGIDHKGKPQRDLIEHSIGPVWEANHVWLIFVLVVLWTGFPQAFSSMASTLYVPLTAVAIGVILRGAGFAFRRGVTTLAHQRAFGVTFALSSIITPYFLGCIAGAIASGRVPPGNAAGNVITSWNNPTSWLGGVLAVLACADLAAMFLASDAERRGLHNLAKQFRLRAGAAAVTTGVVALVGIGVIHSDSPLLFHGLTHRGVLLLIVSAMCGVASLALAYRNHFSAGRIAVAGAVGAVVWGWALGQYPYLLPTGLTINEGAAPATVMHFLIGALVAGSVFLVPSLILLFRLVHSSVLEHD